jgi:hypothetical protein
MSDSLPFTTGRQFLMLAAVLSLLGWAGFFLVSSQSNDWIFLAEAVLVTVLPALTILSLGRNKARGTDDLMCVVLVSLTALLAALFSAFLAAAGMPMFLVPMTCLVVSVVLIRSSWKGGKHGLAATVIQTLLAGYLAIFIVPQVLQPNHGGARAGRVRSDVANLGKAVARVRTDTGNSSLGCLTNLTANLPATIPPAACNPAGGTLANCLVATPGYICWGGPYIPIVTNDAWNHPYTATLDTTTFAITIFSRGLDGIPSADDITFIQ